MTETTDQYLARIGSRSAMEDRQHLRLSGQINQPVRGPRGLALLVSLMVKRNARREPADPPKLIVVPAKAVPKHKGKRWRNKGRSGN